MDDVREIEELKVRYARLSDAAELYRVPSLCTPDVVCDLGPAFGPPTQGRDELAARLATFADLATPWGVLHVLSNPLVEVDGDDAAGSWYLQTMLAAPGPPPLLELGTYTDTFRRCDGRWLFASTRLQVRWSRPPG